MKKDGGERGGTGEGVSFCAVLSLVYRGPELTLDHDSFRRVCVKDVVCEGGLVLEAQAWLLFWTRPGICVLTYFKCRLQVRAGKVHSWSAVLYFWAQLERNLTSCGLLFARLPNLRTAEAEEEDFFKFQSVWSRREEGRTTDGAIFQTFFKTCFARANIKVPRGTPRIRRTFC